LLALIGTFAVLSTLIVAVVKRWSVPIRDVLRQLEQGEEVRPEAMELARRLALTVPYRSAVGSVLTWGLVYPHVIAAGIRIAGEVPPPELVMAGLLVGPLTGIVALLSYDILVRPVFAALFEGGDPGRYRSGWMLSVRGRVMVSVIFVGPYWFTMAMVLLGQELARGRSPEETLPLLGYLLLISVFLTAVFAVLIRYNLSRPLERLAGGIEFVQDGRLDARLPIECCDRLVAYHYNHTAEGLDERRRLEEAMARYTSPELAESAKRGTTALGVKRQHLVVLFSDVRSFTTMAERLTPEALVDSLNRYFALMVVAVTEEGGSVNKFIGDGLMALFGAPAELVAPERAAIRAGQRMLRALEAFNAEQRRLHLPEFAIGIGITSGDAVVGNIGSKDRMEYRAIGDVVNTAARFEGLTREVGVGILVDVATAEAVGGDLECTPRGVLPVKGKEAAVPVFEPGEALAARETGLLST
jgi:class 3 adenylate cyclase